MPPWSTSTGAVAERPVPARGCHMRRVGTGSGLAAAVLVLVGVTAAPMVSAATLPTTRSFHSEPGLHPPAIRVTATGDPRAGDVFLDAQGGPHPGAVILDGHGRLVWFHPAPSGGKVIDVRVQTYRGRRVLTFWKGRVLDGHGEGEDLILNDSYQTVATVHAGNGYHADLHEFTLTKKGTALITAYAPVRADLSSVGGPRRGIVEDSIAQEVDVRSGRVLWQWDALGHVPLVDSYTRMVPAGRPYDYFHINSIQELPDGNFVISARNTWAVYYVDRATGQVRWELGGKASSFEMGRNTQFEWQHDARMSANGRLTLFDDAAGPAKESQSRALVFRLDTRTMQATLAHQYVHKPATLARSQGSVQTLPDANVFVGWGAQPWFSEYTPGGKQIFSGEMPGQTQSYQAFRFPWIGRPKTRPAIALRRTSTGGITVYVSWNGATQVASWQVLAGPSRNQLSPVKEASLTGFETAIRTGTTLPYLAVRALDRRGKVLASSKVVANPL